MGSRVDVNPETQLRALVAHAQAHGGRKPGTLAWGLDLVLRELDRLRAVELAASEAAAQHERDVAELAGLRTVLESRTPHRDEWEHAAQLLHRWVSDTRWRAASETDRQRSRTRVAQLAVELGLIDV